LLIAVAKRLKQAFGSETFISRIGGDEFLFLMDNVSPLEMERRTATLRKILSEPCNIDGHLLSTVASLGLSYYPDHGESTDELISAADAHMYNEKRTRQTSAFLERLIKKTPVCF